MIIINLSFVVLAEGDGIQTTTAKVFVDELLIGRSYRVSEEDVQVQTLDGYVWTTNVFLTLTNTSLIPKDIRVVNLPFDTPDEGYEVIPDVSWIRPENRLFSEVGTGETVYTEILVSIPDDEEHLGKRYQAKLLSYIDYGMYLGVGVISKVYLHIAGERKLSRYCPKRSILTPNRDGINDYVFFDGFPDTIKIYDVTGRRIKTIHGPPYRWDGRNDEERFVEAGVYIYQFDVEGSLISGVVAVAR
ncbi:MAG: gliding motility-associated C-terminal domain-containing protein [bacterium]